MMYPLRIDVRTAVVGCFGNITGDYHCLGSCCISQCYWIPGEWYILFCFVYSIVSFLYCSYGLYYLVAVKAFFSMNGNLRLIRRVRQHLYLSGLRAQAAFRLSSVRTYLACIYFLAIVISIYSPWQCTSFTQFLSRFYVYFFSLLYSSLTMENTSVVSTMSRSGGLCYTQFPLYE